MTTRREFVKTSACLISDANTIVVGTWMMNPGDEVVVARRLRQVLSGALRGQA